MISQKLSPFQRRQSPPRLSGPSSPAPSLPALEPAQIREKDSLSWGKVALGMGLAATALTGCSQGAPAMQAQPAYELESPELVVLSESTQRIDIAREQKEECFGVGAERECVSEDMAYHPVGLHLGEGVVQDLNGNLFAAPQLVGNGAPAAAVSSPEFVEAHTSYGAGGVIVQFSEGAYTVEGNLFGNGRVFTDSNGATVETAGLFGPQAHLSIESRGDAATIREADGEVATVRENNDHLSVLNEQGATVAKIKHNRASGEYVVDLDGPYGQSRSAVNYTSQSAVRSDDGWAVGEVERTSGGVLEMKSGPHTVLRTEVGQHGWSDQHSGPFGSRIDFSHSGGRVTGGR